MQLRMSPLTRQTHADWTRRAWKEKLGYAERGMERVEAWVYWKLE
mgnify:CR=1 FL=1